jgi:hypothetical protein
VLVSDFWLGGNQGDVFEKMRLFLDVVIQNGVGLAEVLNDVELTNVAADSDAILYLMDGRRLFIKYLFADDFHTVADALTLLIRVLPALRLVELFFQGRQVFYQLLHLV